MKEIMTIEELTEFANKKFNESGLKNVEAAKMIGVSRQVLHYALTKTDARYNRSRIRLLESLGCKIRGPLFELEDC